MAWTYVADGVLPRDQVRLLIGDTDTTDQQMQDGEIAYFISTEGSIRLAAAAAARGLAFHYARQVDKWIGDLKILASQRAKRYQELADMLTGATGSGGMIYAIPSAGGIYADEKLAYEDDANIVKGDFKKGIHDNTSEV